jgi:hypothetical protein
MLISRQISVERRITLQYNKKPNNKMILNILPTQTVLFDHSVYIFLCFVFGLD